MTGWGKWSTVNCARSLNLIILTNGIYTTRGARGVMVIVVGNGKCL